jgi:hypothetical protein
MAKGRVGMAWPSEEVVEHLVADDQLAHGPIGGDVDLVIGLPVARATAAGAGEAVARHDQPLDAVEVSGQAGTRLRFAPPLPIHCRGLHGSLSRYVEAAARQDAGQEQQWESEVARHALLKSNARAVRSSRSGGKLFACVPVTLHSPGLLRFYAV